MMARFVGLYRLYVCSRHRTAHGKGYIIMARLTICKEAQAEATVVSNCFIDYYMTDANDAQLKVYLYLLRMLSAGQSTSVSDMADKFNHTEKDILRALKYWEEKELLHLDYDAAGAPTTIRLSEPTVQSQRLCVVGRPVQESAQPPQELPQPAQETYSKPAYSAADLRSFKEQENTAQILFIAQSYLGKPLTPTELRSLMFIMDVLHFSEDLVDYLLQYCVSLGKKDFKYIERVAISWAEQGITTPAEAQQSPKKYNKNVYAIMNELGKSGSPTAAELVFINRWIKEYGFSDDVIFEACRRTVLATDKHRFEYADSILRSWKKGDVHHKSDIIRIDESFQSKRRTAPKTAPNKFNQFTQNDYNFDELEKELLSN